MNDTPPTGTDPQPSPEEDLSDYWAPEPPISCLSLTQSPTGPTAVPTVIPTPQQTGKSLMNLPHDDYMAAVADELAVYRATPGRWWTEDGNGTLDAVFTDFPTTAINDDKWPHGVYLAWDQDRGWLLIEQGGGRNITELDPDGVVTYSSPRQVACSASQALLGFGAGPICNDGSWVWDSRPLEAAIAAWEAGE